MKLCKAGEVGDEEEDEGGDEGEGEEEDEDDDDVEEEAEEDREGVSFLTNTAITKLFLGLSNRPRILFS